MRIPIIGIHVRRASVIAQILIFILESIKARNLTNVKIVGRALVRPQIFWPIKRATLEKIHRDVHVQRALVRVQI